MNKSLPLNTATLLIRQVDPGDARDLFVLCREEPYRTWLPSQVYDDDAHAQQVVEYLAGQCSDPGDPRLGPYVLVIEHRADGSIIGHVGFSPIDDDVEIGFAIAERYQGRGLAVEAAVAASRWAFDAFQLERILGIAAAANSASRRTLARAGFAHQEDSVRTFQGTEQLVGLYRLAPESTPMIESLPTGQDVRVELEPSGTGWPPFESINGQFHEIIYLEHETTLLELWLGNCCPYCTPHPTKVYFEGVTMFLDLDEDSDCDEPHFRLASENEIRDLQLVIPDGSRAYCIVTDLGNGQDGSAGFIVAREVRIVPGIH